MLHEKYTSFCFIWTNDLWINLINLYFCRGETQWATDAYSPLPHHSQFFINLSYMPSTVCFPSKSFLACIIVPPLEIIHTFDHLYWSSLDILQFFYTFFFFWGERIRAAWNIHGARTKGHLDNHKHYFSKKISVFFFIKTFISFDSLLQASICNSRLANEYCFWHNKFKFVFKW